MPDERILLVRTSALGDIVHCLPALAGLRDARPRARLGWVVEEAFAPLLEGHADLETSIPVATRRWRRARGSAATRREVLALRRRLRDFAPDVVVDLMGNHKGGVIARLSGCRRRLGARRADRREPSSVVWMTDTVAVDSRHAVDRARDLVAALGVSRDGPPLADASHRLLPDVGPTEGTPEVLLQPGAGWGNKRYPADRWAAAARELDRAGVSVGVLAGPGEEALAEAVVSGSRRAARSFPDEGLPALVGRLRAARLVLGGDTGPIHLAHFLGTPVLCLMGPTDPERHGPYRAAERTLTVDLPCSFCYRRYDEEKACLLEIPAPEVAARALAQLGAGTVP